MVLLGTGAGLLTGGLLGPRPAQAAGGVLEAYASVTSVRAGSGTVSVFGRDPHVSMTADVIYPLTVVLIGAADIPMLSTTIRLRNRTVPADASSAGCGWPSSYSFSVPASWPSGLYLVRIGQDNRGVEVPFVVRPATNARRQKMLVQVPFTTMQAYNPYGGKSLYDYNSTGQQRAAKVSFDRPWQHQAYEANDPWMLAMVRWLAAQGYGCDFCSSLDVHADAAALNGYPLLLTAGHDEYWSRPMRESVEKFVAARGNLAVLGANTCWWQVRFEPGVRSRAAHRTLVCFKSRAADTAGTEATKTINWMDLQPAWPQNATFGLGSLKGSVWASDKPRPPTPWLVKQPQHWVFAGTNLTLNAPLGVPYVGYETDALALELGADQMPYPTLSDGTPSGLRILALADCTSWTATAASMGVSAIGGLAAISIHSRNGTVFNAGSVDWAFGLRQEFQTGQANPIGTITRNVLQKLQQPYTEPADQAVRPVRHYSQALAQGDGRHHVLVCGDYVPPGWTLESSPFNAYARPGAGRQALYRYFAEQAQGDGRRYLFALEANLGQGWTLDDVACWVPTAPSSQSVLVYRHHQVQAIGDGWRFMYTTRETEPAWVADGPAFYALKA
ncbi:N,N-dimethylformamidase beta subunit family domain-containing protein [Ideonella sp.]|jgi:hypothetical protein|uniref:N,N-dimethylformamidase beta subunit family domain-containing protein n=1 Tax=Ideonella sp. TaxID=1929293 RepID=UPI0037C0A222